MTGYEVYKRLVEGEQPIEDAIDNLTQDELAALSFYLTLTRRDEWL